MMDFIIRYNNHDLLRAYITGGNFNVNEKISDGEYPLHLACRNGSNKCAAVLIAAGANVNSRDYFGWAPLHDACSFSQYICIEMLLKAGASVNAITNHNRTPLHIACVKNDINTVQLLLEAGADPTIMNVNGKISQDLTTDPRIIELISSCMGRRATKSAL